MQNVARYDVIDKMINAENNGAYRQSFVGEIFAQAQIR